MAGFLRLLLGLALLARLLGGVEDKEDDDE